MPIFNLTTPTLPNPGPDISKLDETQLKVGNSSNYVGAHNGGWSSVIDRVGIPSITTAVIGNIGLSFGTSNISDTYQTLPFSQLYRAEYVNQVDFRSRLSTATSVNSKIMLHGTSAAKRGSKTSKLYAISTVSPLGAYSVFNLNADGYRGYGWGSHGDPNAKIFRLDNTLQSNATTSWDGFNNKWVAKLKNQFTPFRGDRVTVIDYSKRTLNDVYKWKPSLDNTPAILGKALKSISPNYTQDFIKFYLTGPKLYNGSDAVDDIIVFRAILTHIEEQYSPGWEDITMVGRADRQFQYSSFSRNMHISFHVYATDRDELKPIWRKLNALAGYTAPTYETDTIAMKAPWMRITVGDILVQQPVLIDSLSYTLHDSDTTWETNIHKDPEMMEVPLKIAVTLSLKVITEYLPENGGQFYTLAKNNNIIGSIPGNSNWLSDTTTSQKQDIFRYIRNLKF